MGRGKIYRENFSKFDRQAQYGLQEALGILKQMTSHKFDETVELTMRLGVDSRRADQNVRGTVVLPHGTGRKVVVLVLAQGDAEREAVEAGADYVGADEYIEKISQGWTEFDVAIAAPDMMSKVGRLGRILGPRGLMPNPRSGTVTREVGRVVREAKAGRIEFRVDRDGNVHVPVGTLSLADEQLLENINAFVEIIVRARPPAAKGQYVRSMTLCSTMSPGIRLDRMVLGA